MVQKMIKLPENPRILVVRSDRIGDVVLSLPVVTSIRKTIASAHIAFLTRSYTENLLRGRDDINEVITFESENSHLPWSGVIPMAKKLKAGRYDIAIVLFSSFTTSLALRLSGIKTRIGPATKLAQIFLSHKVSQRRSKGEKHEADYNLDLLAPLDISPIRRAFIAPPKGKAPPKPSQKPVIGIHPGSGGSARNWPEEKYSQLIKELCASGSTVVLTGSPAERELVERIAKKSGIGDVRVCITKTGLGELIEVLFTLDALVAPSTGPLHVASALGVPVVGIYCPIKVCLPKRWGPIGDNDTALVPNVPVCEKCIKEACPHWDCMNKIDVSLVHDAVLGKTAISVDL